MEIGVVPDRVLGDLLEQLDNLEKWRDESELREAQRSDK
jgi:hypothetical protein